MVHRDGKEKAVLGNNKLVGKEDDPGNNKVAANGEGKLVLPLANDNDEEKTSFGDGIEKVVLGDNQYAANEEEAGVSSRNDIKGMLIIKR